MKIFKFYRNMFLRLIAMMVIISCIISCAKQEVISDLDFQKSLLLLSSCVLLQAKN
jgi:hypothetical protein